MRKLLTAAEVKQISTACPNLKDMTFDLNRHTRALDSELEEDASIFATVAKMKLNNLQVYYDLGLSSLAQGKAKTSPAPKPLSPTPNKQISDFAASLWKKVFGDTRAGSRILALKFGEWEREIGTGYPARWV